ncbi:MAG: thiamine pyrophosphate-requiring protein [Pseudolabrys sp.]|nr:thiamine pyrophosphate-requiring protein [Pseudolabrys sp.]
MITAGTAFLEALKEAGVSYIFANLGSDHPAIVESVAEGKASSRGFPAMLTCPNEMVALSAAHGYAQVSGQAQAVIVHVECGTQALGGAVHNALRGRVPVLIFAGATPYTQEGELKGSRNEWIQWIQDIADQRGIVRNYVKFDYEFRTGRNIKQVTHRAMQLAKSEPRGPVYLVGAREVMEEEVSSVAIDMVEWPAIAPLPMRGNDAVELAQALARAKRPLVVTSAVGRNAAAVPELIKLCHRLGIGVLEQSPVNLNYPPEDPLYMGNRWSEPHQEPVLADADVILILDSDAPWVPTLSKPSPGARIFHIDVDPLKQDIPLWYFKAQRVFQADCATALAQINEALDGMTVDAAKVQERTAHYSKLHDALVAQWHQREKLNGVITPEYFTAALRQQIDLDNSIILSESITNYPTVINHLRPSKPGSYFLSGGSSLGWHGGAAIGAKLACSDKLVIALSGDGSYMFSVPSSVHWMARKYETPFLQVIYNNGGWRSPKMSTLAVHPQGYASRANEIGVEFDPAPDHAAIAAAAGGAWARRLERPEEVEAAITEALRVVRQEKRCAVLDVRVPHL